MNQPCYEDTKKKSAFPNRLKSTHGGQPLIRNHRSVHDVSKEKQNEKHNTDYHQKNRPQNIVIGDHEPIKPHILPLSANSHIHTTNYVSMNNAYNHDKYANNPPLISATIQFQPPSNRNLTFGNVRNTHVLNIKGKEHDLPQPHYLPAERKVKSTLFDKNNISNDRLSSNNDKIDKRQRVKPSSIIAINKANIDDQFACNEELQFRPVEKKSLIPEKKGEKTTSKFDFIKNKKQIQGKKVLSEKQRERELREFTQVTQKKVNMDAQAESLLTMTTRQQEYSVDPLYIQKNQKNMTWKVRAILVDWMRHVSYEFCLRRQTYHLAVVLLDNYLAKTHHLPKSSLQPIGATCMFIASKLEEFQCKSSQEWAGATNNCCSIEDIHELEIRIVLKTLKFKLNPPTLWSLSNKIMSQWDIFLMNHDYASSHPIFDRVPKPFFKSFDNQSSYVLFRDLMQLIDCSVLDIQTAQYKPKMLVLSFMYLVIGLQIGQWDRNSVVDIFPRSSRYLTNPTNDYNDLFGNYVMYCFGSHLDDLLPTVQYAATYFALPLSYEQPRISESKIDIQGIQLEEYYSYQTYNTAMMKTVYGRERGVYLQGAYE